MRITDKSIEYNEIRKQALESLTTISLRRFQQNPYLIPDKAGIYIIYNIENYKPYIGESSNLRRRLLEHSEAKSGQYIHWDIRKLGIDNFRIGYLGIEPNYIKRREKEKYWVSLFNSYYNGYNGTKDGGSNSLFSRKVQKYINKYLRKYLKGYWDIKKYQGIPKLKTLIRQQNKKR